MKRQHLFLVLLSALCLSATPLRAQNMVLRLQGGTEHAVLLSNLQKITFSGNNLVLNYVTGSTESYGFSSLEKLFFSQGTIVKESVFPKADIYFNATDNQIHFRNLPDRLNRVSVYRMDGMSVINTTVSDGGSIDMSRFPAGIYLIRANNQVQKFKK